MGMSTGALLGAQPVKSCIVDKGRLSERPRYPHDWFSGAMTYGLWPPLLKHIFKASGAHVLCVLPSPNGHSQLFWNRNKTNTRSHAKKFHMSSAGTLPS